jgi:S1-C subfamily serine protease
MDKRTCAAVAGWFLLAACVVASAAAMPTTQRDRDKVKQKDTKPQAEVSRADKAYLGVAMQELDEEVLKGLDTNVTRGVLISQVLEGSPAEEAGIQEGDIVVEFDRKEVSSPDELRNLVEDSRVGEAVKVKVIRDGEPKTLSVTVGQYPEEVKWGMGSPEEFHWYGHPGELRGMFFGSGRLGVRVTDLNEDLAPYFGVKEGEGVLVLGVNEESTAEKMGIKSGDVIVKMKGEAVGSVDDLTGMVGKLESGEKFDVSIVRSKKAMTLEGEAPESLSDLYRKEIRIGPEAQARKLAVMSDAEMDKLKQEMKSIQKELEDLKKELGKMKESR